jgi:hypothetical protein
MRKIFNTLDTQKVNAGKEGMALSSRDNSGHFTEMLHGIFE